jgi:hypothetical protein
MRIEVKGRRGFAFLSRILIQATVMLTLFSLLSLAFAQSAREERDKADVKKQEFLKRLPLESRCLAEVAGGVLLPDGEKQWKAGPFEVEKEDHFNIKIFMLSQLNPEDQQVCEQQARALEHESVQRARYLDNGSIVCMRRIYDDKNRLPQLTACHLRTLLTQPAHLRCKNLDPILDPDGIFVAPNLMAVVTLPQAVMTKGSCQAKDRY